MLFGKRKPQAPISEDDYAGLTEAQKEDLRALERAVADLPPKERFRVLGDKMNAGLPAHVYRRAGTLIGRAHDEITGTPPSVDPD